MLGTRVSRRRFVATSGAAALATPFISIRDYLLARTQSDLIQHVQSYVSDTALVRANLAMSKVPAGQTIVGIKTDHVIETSKYMKHSGFTEQSSTASTLYTHDEGKIIYAGYTPDGLNCCIPFMNVTFADYEDVSHVYNCTTLIEGPSLVCLSVVTREMYKRSLKISNEPNRLCRSLVYPAFQSRRGLNRFERCDASKHQDIYDCEIGHVEIDYPCDANGRPEGYAMAEVRNRSTAEVIAKVRVDYSI
jgi:hypothetical protein